MISNSKDPQNSNSTTLGSACRSADPEALMQPRLFRPSQRALQLGDCPTPLHTEPSVLLPKQLLNGMALVCS